MRFLADMGISPLTVRYLQEMGHEATHLHSLGLDEMSDLDILQKAQREETVLLTHDLDFSQLLALYRAAMPSVITFRLRDMTPANVNRYMRRIIEQHTGVLSAGAQRPSLSGGSEFTGCLSMAVSEDPCLLGWAFSLLQAHSSLSGHKL